MRIQRLVIGLVIVLGAWYVVGRSAGTPVSKVVLHADKGEETVFVEVAATLEQQARGLMGRHELSDEEGMLFVWNDVFERRFWMKDTPIGLDLIAIDEGKVVSIETMVPCRMDPCLRYTTAPAKTVLEVRAGWATDHGLEVGDTAELTYVAPDASPR